MSHETWQSVNGLNCLLPKFSKLFDTKENKKKYCMGLISDSKIDFKVKYIWVKDFLKQNKLQKVYNI